MHDALDGGADENGLIGERNDFEFGRDVGQDSRQRSLHLVDDRQRGSFAVTRDGHENAAGAIGTNDVLLWLKAVANLGDILDVDRAPLTVRIGRLFNSSRMPGLLLTRTWYSVLASLAVPAGRIRFCRLMRVRDVDGRELLRVEFIEVKVDHDGSGFAAERVRDGGALNGAEGCSNEVIAEVEDLVFAESLAGEAELENRDAGRVVLQDVRREHAGRHLAQGGVHRRAWSARWPCPR